MKLPRLYSLSTVGVRKHLHQDYLLHPIRTDFTGSNGIGKSIVADLVQLIFITDRNLVEFGTDSLDPDERKIEGLPYGSNEAYVFLNVEMSTDQFLTIGVCISAKKGIPLRPFTILAKPDLRLPVNELVYDKSRLLRSGDFLSSSNAVLPIQQAARSIEEQCGLYLKYFQYRENLLEYYSFLFNKGVLSINLAKAENMKAFAKIIQSFSKAKGLDLKDSRALKTFLFEDSEKEYEAKFKEYERELRKLLHEFHHLENDIADIEAKQLSLTKLKADEIARNKALLAYKKAELHQAFLDRKELTDAVKSLEKQIGQSQLQIDTLKPKVTTLEKQAAKAEAAFEIADTNLTTLLKYQSQSLKYQQLGNEIEQLERVSIPELDQSSTKAGSPVEINKWNAERITTAISAQLSLFQDYGQLVDIEKKYETQHNALNMRRDQANRALEHSESWLKALSLTTENSLFNAVLKKKEALTPQQESVLHHLIGLSLTKPPQPLEGNQYAISTDILLPRNIELDEPAGGMWLRLGDMREFVPKLKGESMFDKPEKLETAIAEKRQHLEQEIDRLKLIKTQLTNAERGIEFDAAILDNFDFDLRLAEFSAINRAKEVVGLVNAIGTKIASLQKLKKEEETHLQNLTKKLTIAIEEDLAKQIKEVENQKSAASRKKKELTGERDQHRTLLNELENSNRQKQGDVARKNGEKKEASTKLETLTTNFRKAFEEAEVDHEKEPKLTEEQFDDLFEEARDTQVAFISQYNTVIGRFEDTKNGHERITPQIEGKIYSFLVLESVLLGKIGHLDQITPYLAEANSNRTRMMDSIRDNMIKLFSFTRDKYAEFERTVRGLNSFFKGQKISEEYFVYIRFDPHPNLNIALLDKILEQGRWSYKRGELALGTSVQDFVEDLFYKEAALRKKVSLLKLLNPKSYFDLKVTLTDENNIEIPGSTGESYSAITLLGIARLSEVQTENRDGIKFIILEESANLDNINFNTFPKIAKEHGYQILTMTPRPYGTDSEEGWYMHQLIKGKRDKMINYPQPASYFRSKHGRQDLETFLNSENR